VPGEPALGLLFSLPFYLGVALALRRWRQPGHRLLLLAGGMMLLNTIFSQYAPHFRRALGVTPSVALLSGLGLATLVDLRASSALRRLAPWAGLAPVTLAAVIILGGGTANVSGYFSHWGTSPDLYYAYDKGLWQIAGYVRDLPTVEAIFVTRSS
jgi:hypothetical protein